MHFARSEYLNLLWGLPVLAVFFAWSFRQKRKRLELLVGRALVAPLTMGFSRTKAVVRALLLCGFFTSSVLALARPQWGTRLETVRRKGLDLVIALDTSYSMNTEDIAPSRLEKAKREIRSLIARLRGDRVGLVAFAGTAILYCPLTLDYGAANLFLDGLDTGVIPDPGTAIAPAIQTATSAFSATERKYKILTLFTDGEDLEGDVEAAVEKARADGVIIYTVGIGTPEGKPIPIRDEKGDVVEYRKDDGGQIVVSRLDERALAQIAVNTGGRYFRASASESELDAIYDEISKQEKKELESRLYQNFEDRFQYPLAMAIAFLIAELWMSERRGRDSKSRVAAMKITRPLIVITFGFVLLAGADVVEAASAGSKNKEGNRHFAEGKYEEALKAYLEAQAQERDRPELLYNVGNTFIRQKKYEQALQSLRQVTSKGDKGLQAAGWFNAGNALFENGNFGDSAQAYIQSLRLNPADREAKHNLELALKKMQEQQQKQRGQGQKQNKEQDSNQPKDQGSKDQQPQSQDSAPPQAPQQPADPQAAQANNRDGSLTKERALQILDALQNQELAERRKLLEQRNRRKAGGRDW
jgi:Ca-activated chloride channel homolog